MIRQWALVVSDFRREYHMPADELAAIDMDEFALLLKGLSEHARFPRAWQDEPKHLYDPTDIAAVRAAARR